MEWVNSSSSSVQEKQQRQKENEGEMMAVEGLCEKVMSDEQMEVLRKQIAVYAMICEQLVDMHKSFSAQYDIAENRRQQQQQNEGEMMVVEGLYVKVMTDEQMELLRKQIVVD
ncbi:hypothetical protein Ddye_007436 [Dipteronia dyeriana]|uniref:Uncharacterized protein n=1 Tax=Dipteronia dyeriana TaxID=168575 RepID=A0AAD9XKE6_9ROSI|nr:hypothetical protein Ddye_007436 [Dipteronia dyeriana]